MIKLRDLGANIPTGVPCTEEQILALVRTPIDDMLAERDQQAKAQKREIDLLRSFVKSDTQMAQLLSQLGSQSEIGSGWGRSRSGDDHKGGDEDASGDDEEGN
ncbi:hypothetical protein Tco_1033346 [Tanacetum coccineum]